MSNDWEGAEMAADAEKWRSISKILRNWVGEVAFQAKGVLSDGITPMCGKFETEELWRQANALLKTFTKPGQTKDDIHVQPAIKVGKRLFTKDGRKVGNGIIVGKVSHNPGDVIGEVWRVETDFGNTMQLTKMELLQYYYLDWEPPYESEYKHSLENWFEKRDERQRTSMRATDELVSRLWESLIDEGWKQPMAPTTAITKFIESLPDTDETVVVEKLDRVGVGEDWDSYASAGPVSFVWIEKPCVVSSEDFSYKALCLCSFPKSSGKVRYIVEDNGRLFIQRREQITFIEDRPFNPE